MAGKPLMYLGEVNQEFAHHGCSDSYILDFLQFTKEAIEQGVDVSDFAGRQNSLYNPEDQTINLIDFDGQYESAGRSVPEDINNKPLTTALFILITRVLTLETPRYRDLIASLVEIAPDFRERSFQQLKRCLTKAIEQNLFTQSEILTAIDELANKVGNFIH